ncbi:MAG TPA: uroporphyrinogen-III synthase [Phnomibacter sp.]|nr:uroporphyrinogen-III synthase [Phnomibacter sp.]
MDKPGLHILSTASFKPGLPALLSGAAVVLDTVPMITISHIVDEPIRHQLRQWAAQPMMALFTSRQAVYAVSAAIAPLEPRWQVGCLQGATLQAVQKHLPYCNIMATAPFSASLAQACVPLIRQFPVHFFCGNLHLNHIAHCFAQHNIPLQQTTVYHTVLTPVAVKGHYDAILFFSPSAVKSYFTLNRPKASTVLFATGPGTAAAITPYDAGHTVVVAHQPGGHALMEAVIQYFGLQPPALPQP